ncbi:uncharacterized protein LOC114516831 isoform X2 [Dendronephthya gigantea]|uniref:uncharacterized protein LOC114516831 isoform X2 n=1 Tax=Dendronephthya gigantea TaxID=151771 RepID=UPI00106C9D93|nr:uncharacterized protein LOC114516831 isoform X2 [Dendronephthya gigantea]
MALHVWLSIMAVIYSYLLRDFASAETGDFYVLGSDGIYVIDPVAKSVVAKITNAAAPGLCSKKQHRESCKFSQVCVFNGTVFIADYDADAVHVIDVRTHKKIETIPTGKFPLRLYCLPWRKEVWVQLYDYRSTYSFDVFETDGRTRTRVSRAQPQSDAPGNTMLSEKDMLEGKTAFVTDNAYPGIHELNLETKNYTRFRNFSRQDGGR